MKNGLDINRPLPTTDSDVEALVDQQLEPAAAEQVWRDINFSPALHAKYLQLMKQKQLLQAWWMLETQENREKFLTDYDALETVRH
jgi:hypothetical protein